MFRPYGDLGNGGGLLTKIHDLKNAQRQRKKEIRGVRVCVRGKCEAEIWSAQEGGSIAAKHLLFAVIDC